MVCVSLGLPSQQGPCCRSSEFGGIKLYQGFCSRFPDVALMILHNEAEKRRTHPWLTLCPRDLARPYTSMLGHPGARVLGALPCSSRSVGGDCRFHKAVAGDTKAQLQYPQVTVRGRRTLSPFPGGPKQSSTYLYATYPRMPPSP